MSLPRKLIAITTACSTAAALAISSAGVAWGAATPSIPSAIISVHADPGHISTRLVGTSCGGEITVMAKGTGGGAGKAGCGHSSVVVAASTGGTFGYTFAPPSSSFVCQANALFASASVDVTCTENAD